MKLRQERDLKGYEGPRTPDEEEWERVSELRRLSFYPQKSNWRDGFKTWPISFTEEYARNTLAMFYSDEPVSAVSWVVRDFTTLGHKLSMAFIGGVCTHPDHRERGLASVLLSACLNRLRKLGADFVYISGARPLYYSIGANHAGCFTRFKLKAPALSDVEHIPVRLRESSARDVELLSALYQREPTRFIRPVIDYLLTTEYGYCSGKACTFQVIEEGGEPVGYLLVADSAEWEGRQAKQVLEFCGDRWSVLSALSSLVSELRRDHELYVEVPRKDPLCRMLSSLGLSGELSITSGTFKVLDFCGTMERLLPYFESRLPQEVLRKIEFSNGWQRYVVHSTEGYIEINGEANMLWSLLGAPEQRKQNFKASGRLQALVEHCLPIPIPSLHLNMV